MPHDHAFPALVLALCSLAACADPAPPPVVLPSAVDDDQLLGHLGLADLRLLAVVASAQGPLAMVADPSGFGTTLRRGMFVGRPDVVRGSRSRRGSAPRAARPRMTAPQHRAPARRAGAPTPPCGAPGRGSRR
ncbi:MAG: hypothetical protein Q8S73_36170 [Deltaproteobacteria bacterium]|nr:hypothetical protein [Myxococcales bacterium]MDP3219595.1 hypothetical protein [Deltaproteobacteria bacterium]